MTDFPYDVGALPKNLRELEICPEVKRLDYIQSALEKTVNSIVALALKDIPYRCEKVKEIVLRDLSLGVAALWDNLAKIIPLNPLNALFLGLINGGLLKQRIA